METKTKRRAAKRLEAETNIHKAMSHPLRHEIFDIFSNRVASPNEIANELLVDLTDVSYHVRRLYKYDCIELVDTRQVRGATEHFYKATRRPLLLAEDWEDLPAASKRILADDFMQRILDDYTVSREAGIVGEDKFFHIARTPTTVDLEGREEILSLYESLRLIVLDVEAESLQRMKDSGEEAIHMSSSTACFAMPASGRDQETPV